jgi:hypothetical protein
VSPKARISGASSPLRPRGASPLAVFALHLVPEAVQDLGVGQGGHVSDVGEVGDSRDDPAHDLAGAGLGHVRHDPYPLRPGDLADLLQDLYSTNDSTATDAVRQATWNGTRATPVGDSAIDNSHRT